MMRIALLSILIILSCLSALAQKNGSIKGQLYDSIAKQPVGAATVSVMDRSDSSLVSFTMTGNDGRFELKGIPNGQYRLLVTHVSYYNNNSYFNINDSSKNIDLGQVQLFDRSKVLEEVVVTNEAPPVTMVGDTIQYNAGSFKTIPNASVEQLLKKLPGVKVDKDGTVTAQGEKVAKVLVDGKEFFGNDPKIATRNLPADAVDKVQVYDKQSDQATLTGFEDGNYEKTINLKLKKDKKKGVFGKINGGSDFTKRYEGKFNVNSFKGARQFSAIGMGNNTNAEGFSFMDILNFTGALSQMKQGAAGGNINISVSKDDADALGMGGNNNAGIKTAWGGGLNYNNIIGKDHDFQSNYFYNHFEPKVSSRIYRQNIFQGASNFYNENSFSDNINNTNRVNLNDLWQLDSSSTLRIIPTFSYQKTDNISSRNYSTTAADGSLINAGFSDSRNHSEGYNFRNELSYRKKFKRKGRTLSLNLQNSLNKSDGDGSLNSIINYYTAGIISGRDTLNQRSSSHGDLKGFTARAVYTEPIWKRSLLEFSASRSRTSSSSNKLTYDYNSGSGKYDALNSTLSNDFENSYSYTNAGMRLRKQSRKYSYSLGANWQKADLEGKIITNNKDSLISKSFTNILPSATFKYNFSKFRTFTLNYNANTNQPSLSQLQPVPDNSNPLYIREGNPDLKQEFSHNFRGNMNLMSPYKNKNFFLFFNTVFTDHKIVNYDSLDLATGIRRSRPVNVNGVFNFNADLNYSLPVKFLKGSIEWGNTVRFNKGKQFINSQLNEIRQFAWGPQWRLDVNPTQKLNLNFGAELNYNRTRYSAQPSQNNNYLSQEYTASMDWDLPKQFAFSSSFAYTINDQLSSGFNARVPIWNASISRQFLKFNRGELKFAATDLLNRNQGISRNTSQNYIEDKEVNTLKRFFLLSFTYSLTKSGLNSGGGGNMRVISR
ncbi:MAG: TonB-dependent receptor family protein [Chitinophagaceae bacterium]|nr:TonB-dependent receptor family protein [Chitinophagaceae bacterium]